MNLNTIWNLVNSCLLVLVMIFVLVHYSLPEIALDKVEEMEIRLDEINRYPSDTTVIIINNYIISPIMS